MSRIDLRIRDGGNEIQAALILAAFYDGCSTKVTRLSAFLPMSVKKKTGTLSEPKRRRLEPLKWSSKI